MNIKKEFIPFIIGFGIICLNIPIVLLFYFLNPNLMDKFAKIIVPLECIMIGITIIYSQLKGRKEEIKDYKTCEGTIKKSDFKLNNSNWLKTPIVSYVVDGKKYETNSNIGINGIVSFFLKGKKIKVYYKQSNPKITLSNNNTPLIVGSFFIIIGICIFFIFI